MLSVFGREKMPVTAAIEEWLALGDRLYAKGVDVFNGSQVMESELGTRDPKVVALTLLARTIGHFQAAVNLLESKHAVEARTLTRCCWENLFWIAALSKKGDEFVKAMELDDAANRMKRANKLLQWAKAQEQPLDFVETLAAFYSGMKDKHGKPRTIPHEQAARDGGVGDGYQVYRELSGDAAHPSAVSLSRHVTWGGPEGNQIFTVHALPTLGTREVEDTLEVLCSAVLGIIVAANEVTGGTAPGEPLTKLADDFKALSNANKFAREAAKA